MAESTDHNHAADHNLNGCQQDVPAEWVAIFNQPSAPD